MYNLIKLPKQEFDTIILNTASRRGMSAASLRKTFVFVNAVNLCYILMGLLRQTN